MKDFNDTFLARWMTGEASLEEISAFKKHRDYNKYQQIKEASESLSFVDFNEEIAFNRLKTKIAQKTKNTVIYKWAASIAVCAVITISFTFLNNDITTYSSKIAKQKEFSLPDGSIVVLNASAEAKINKESWKENRTVFLEGEAFFKVKKGAKFTVKTKLGSVEVLGTEFTVNSLNKDLMTVKCFEGKVKVISSEGIALLAKGNAFQEHNKVIEKWRFENEAPNWLSSKETSLYKVSITEVITLLKRQYDLNIEQQEFIDTTLLFTGSFTNNDLEKALYSVFGTLNVNYKLVNKNEVRILSE